MHAAAFTIFSTTNGLKGYIPGQLVFGHDMILPMKHKVDRELILQIKPTKINKDNICENRTQVNHNYKVVDEVIINYQASYKY